jgi:hypothetical protein
MKKVYTAICLLGVACLAFAFGHVSVGESAPTHIALTGRTDQSLSFVTDLQDGRFRWFDTNLRAPCTPRGHFDFSWHSVTMRSPYAWDGHRLRVHTEGPTNDGKYRFVADLLGTYSSATGLRGTIQVSVRSDGEFCASGPVEFWAAADR